MKNEKFGESLRRVHLFNGLTDNELLQIARLCKIWRVQDDQVIFHEGDDGNQLFIIQEGRFRVSLATRRADGQLGQSTINLLYSGQSFGELVLLYGNTRSATITSMEPGVLLVLNAADFDRLCESNPRIGYHVMGQLARDLAYKLRSSNLLLRGNIRWQHDELGQRTSRVYQPE